MGLLAAFVALGGTALAASDGSQIKISRALNSPTLAVKYSGVHAALVELRLNGESFGTRTMDDAPTSGETTFSMDILALKDGDNELEIRLYDKAGHLVGSEKTVISTDTNTKGPVYLTTPKVGDNVQGPVEISVGFGRDFKNSYVSFFVDNQFKSMVNFPPYTYTWDSTRESNGWHEVEAWVVDDTSATFKTRKVRIFVNNPGGRTYRIDPSVTKPATLSAPILKPAEPKLTKPVVKKAAAKPSKKISPLPLPKPLDLTTSANQVSADITGTAAALKPLATAESALSTAKTTALAPAVAALTFANTVASRLEGSAADLKPAPMPESIATGPRLLMPTGKRVVAPKVEKVAAPNPSAAEPVKPAPTAPKIEQPAFVKPKVVKVFAPSPNVLSAVAPITDMESAIAALKSLSPAMTTNPELSSARAKPLAPAEPTVPKAAATKPVEAPKPVAEVSKPVVEAPKPVAEKPKAAAPKSIVVTPKKPAPAPLAVKSTTIPVLYGSKLPIRGSYTIVYGGAPLTFDVAPHLEEGVPVTPFRHLIEKAGGEVKWAPDDQEITAITDGKNIWLKIGDKVAKINNLPVSLELAPFLEKGRTIVPLSFLKSALNVDIEYDKATGHVLITPKA